MPPHLPPIPRAQFANGENEEKQAEGVRDDIIAQSSIAQFGRDPGRHNDRQQDAPRSRRHAGDRGIGQQQVEIVHHRVGGRPQRHRNTRQMNSSLSAARPRPSADPLPTTPGSS